jgi:hypothetical protein
MQHSLLDWEPPVSILGDRSGETFDRARDGARLNGQAADVFHFMSDGEWHTLAEISSATGHPEASVSARLRDLRSPKLGGFKVDREFVRRGLWRYRLQVQA